jgi:hypothetical protein
MLVLLRLIATLVIDLFKSQRRLEAENLFLRHQLSIAVRRAPRRFPLRRSDRLLLVWMIRLMPSLLDLSQIVRPETILRWHRAGFRAYWRWKSRRQVGRPRTDRELRELIRRMSNDNPLWGAPRIHGELLKLGFEVAQSTVSKYMIPPWTTVARLADIPVQQCRSHCGDRSMRGADADIRATVRVGDSGPRSTAARVVCGHPVSDS